MLVTGEKEIFYGLDYLEAYKTRYQSGEYNRVICVGPVGSGRDVALKYITGEPSLIEGKNFFGEAHKLSLDAQIDLVSKKEITFLKSETLLTLIPSLVDTSLVVRTRKPSAEDLRSFIETLDWPSSADFELILQHCDTYKKILYVRTAVQEGEQTLEQILGISHLSLIDKVLSSSEDYTLVKEAVKELSLSVSAFDLYYIFADRCIQAYEDKDSLFSQYGDTLLVFSRILRREVRPAIHVSELISDIVFLVKKSSHEAPFLKAPSSNVLLEKTNSRVLSQRKLIKNPEKNANILYSAEMLSSRLGIKCQRLDGYP